MIIIHERILIGIYLILLFSQLKLYCSLPEAAGLLKTLNTHFDFPGSPCVVRGDTCSCVHSRDKIVQHQQQSSNTISNFLSICCQPSVTILHFQGQGIRSVKPEVFAQFACHGIQELTLEQTSVTPSSIATLGDRKYISTFIGLPNLVRLRLIYNHALTQYPNGIFATVNTSLEELSLIGNPVRQLTGREFEGLLGSRSRLVQLDLSDNQLEMVNFHWKNLTGEMQRLRRLSLKNNQLKTIEPHMFVNFPQLEDLNLAGNPIEHLDMTAFQPVGRLRKLIVSRNLDQISTTNTINDKNAQTSSLPQIPVISRDLFHSFRDLQELTLAGLNSHKIELEGLKSLDRLRSLNVGYNRFERITDFFPILQDSTTIIKLVLLNATHNEILCLESEVFRPMQKLRTLDLSHNLITVITKSTFLWLQSLRILDLTDNPLRQIEPEAFLNVGGLHGLEYLNLDTLLDDIAQQVSAHLETTALGLLSSTTTIRGLEKWGIFRGANRTLNHRSESSDQVSFKPQCPMDGRAGYDFKWPSVPAISGLHPNHYSMNSNPNNHRLQENGKSKSGFIHFLTNFSSDEQDKQNILATLIGACMTLLIISLTIMMVYRLCQYRGKWRTKRSHWSANPMWTDVGDINSNPGRPKMPPFSNTEQELDMGLTNTCFSKWTSKPRKEDYSTVSPCDLIQSNDALADNRTVAISDWDSSGITIRKSSPSSSYGLENGQNAAANQHHQHHHQQQQQQPQQQNRNLLYDRVPTNRSANQSGAASEYQIRSVRNVTNSGSQKCIRPTGTHRSLIHNSVTVTKGHNDAQTMANEPVIRPEDDVITSLGIL